MRSFLYCLLICVASMFLPVANANAADFKVYTQENILDGKRVEQNYAANNFYSTYYIYLDVIRKLEVDRHLSGDEIGQVIGELIAGLKKNGMAQLVVLGYPGAGDLRVTLRIAMDKRRHRPILLVISNYDAEKEDVVDSGDMRELYATYYYLVGDKLVKYQYVVYPGQTEREAQDTSNNIADYYLRDAESDDDAKGKAMLIDGIKKEKKDDERLAMNLTLAEYYMLENDADGAKKALEAAKGIAGSIVDAREKQQLWGMYKDDEAIYKYKFMVDRQSNSD